MDKPVNIIGAGLAGSEAALQLARRGVPVRLYEMRPNVQTPVHKTGFCAELVCSNSLKGTKPDTAAGMLKRELDALGSALYRKALENSVPAGGALAVDRELFAKAITREISEHPLIELATEEIYSIEEAAQNCSALLLATGPLTGDSLAASLEKIVGDSLAFYDAAAPIVMADSLNMDILFRQSRYAQAQDDGGMPQGDYLNAPFNREEYDQFIAELVKAERVISKDFETRDLFQACQPIEEIARKGVDAPRFGPLKPVGLEDPRTGRRPWAAVQLRAEDLRASSYNLVGFQTNLKFSEQQRIFRLIPGLKNAEFARYGVMHRNTFIDAPKLLDSTLRLVSGKVAGSNLDLNLDAPVFVAGQLGGTEGYCEAMRSGLHAALSIAAWLFDTPLPELPNTTAFGALIAHATSPDTKDYQPMHVNFGIMPPLERPIRNKRERYTAFASRGANALKGYCEELTAVGLLEQ